MSDAIAIVGIGCRFPGGVRTADQFWRALMDGVDVIGEVPSDRWDSRFHADGAIHSALGGFLDDVDRFDGSFFSVSPREAADMDPQQRILLETTFEAMQDAGRPMPDWVGSRTSVHIGMLGSDYSLLHAKTSGAGAIGPYYASGKEFSFAAGRIAYTFGLHGACMTVTTACSSSLAAVQLACQGLRDGTADTAIAGGVNVLVAPELSIFMSKVQAMSRTGRCRPFDTGADGIVRGEGCAVVVLKRYADAVRDNDQVYGLVLGGAINHDGQSAGLTVPNAAAQQALLREALSRAGVGGHDVAYVEAHGTGTPLGDPLEVSSLAEVMGKGRPGDRPLIIGSLKANFGHMDATAGVAGLVKAALVLRHGRVPQQVHLTTPSPHIPWEESGVVVAAEDMILDTGRPLIAGVSAFGLSGTNVHVVLGAPPPRPAPAGGAPAGPRTLLVSASTPLGLRELSGDFARALSERPADEVMADEVVATAAVRRTHHAHRLAVVGDTTAELVAGLDAFAARQPHPNIRAGTGDAVPRTVFAFSGHGAQWPGMALDLYASEPDFRTAFDECDRALAAHSGWSASAVLQARDDAALRSTETGQPVLFALQVALSRLWMSWGVRPDAVVGHSMGEIAAAHIAGALTLPDAAWLMVVRSRACERASGTGRMASVDLGADEMRTWLGDEYPGVTIAAVNSPGAVVLSGPAEPLRRLVARLQERDVTAVELSVEYPSHGPLMQTYADQLRELLDGLAVRGPDVPFLSTTLGGYLEGRPLDPEYWALNLRQPVLFWPAVDRLLADEDCAVVEMGPHPVLHRALRAAMNHRSRTGPVVASLVRGEDASPVLAKSRAELHVSGVPVRWDAVWGRPVAAVALPPERWGCSTYWLPGVVRGAQGGAPAMTATETEPIPASSAGDRPALVRTIQRAVADILGQPDGGTLNVHRGFFELGLDSISAVELADRLRVGTGLAVDGADVLRCGTIGALAERLSSSSSTRTARVVSPAPDPASQPIAVVGLACRVPGGSDASGFWQLLEQGLDPSADVPPDRWDGTHRGSFLPAIDGFDHQFFRVSPREARSMDPQQRLFLEVAWEALEDAGLAAAALRDSETAVYVGLNTTDYQQLVLAGEPELSLYYGTGNCFSGAAGRLSYLLGLRGPSMAVDTACSSSLTSVHLACQALRAGECRVAVAGGANIMATSTVFEVMSAAGALSRDGRCKTFAEGADGYGRGEGAGVVVLKPLSAALSDGDRVHAVIRGSAVNQDGASGGLTVPSGAAQQAVIMTALDRAGVTAADLSYLEAHGTGTPLGDAVELRAIADVLRDAAPLDQPLLVGSVKSNIGHLEAAAGVVGLIKVVLSLRHECLPAQLHLEVPTRAFDWEASGVAPVRRPTPWRRGRRPRIAGISAFGFTGTNAHLIVEEPPREAAPTAQDGGPYLVAVSAADGRALAEAATRLADQISFTDESDLADLVWTGLARRGHLEHRAAVVASTGRDLARALRRPHHAGSVAAGEPLPLTMRLGSRALPWRDLAEAASALPGWEPDAAAALRTRVGSLPQAGPEDPAGAFVSQLATATVWRAVGLTPTSVTGEPYGALVAACLAGELTPQDALRHLPTVESPAAGTTPGEPGVVLDLSAGPATVWLAGRAVHRMPDGLTTAEAMLNVIAALHVHGVVVDWTALLPAGGRVVSLPSYPWQRSRHWVDARDPRSGPPAEVGRDGPAPDVEVSLPAITALPADRRVPALVDLLLPLVAEILGTTDEIDPHRGFFDLGFDSILSVKLKRRAEQALRVDLPKTVLFECPNTAALARFVDAEVLAAAELPTQDVDELDSLSEDALSERLAAVLAAAESHVE
ncbi:type I polyketide synthase [Micromonospora sp. LOL_015]|uniref:type I polyketide synthase n=1 Tax=Micromonospora sp. LOL_015 TaxID=3345416 RepID=UPI003A88EA38